MYSLPVRLRDTLQARPDTLQNLYDDLALSPAGGFFPVGATGLWHGGVHLSPGGALPIYASAPGRIVAARLAEDADDATTQYGHSNFLLTRHTWQPDSGAGVPYYMLYMHLQPMPLMEVARAPDAASWFAGAPLLRITASNGLNLRSEPDVSETSKQGSLPTRQLVKPLGEPVDALGYRWREVAVVGRDASRDDATGFVATRERPTGDGEASSGRAERWVERAEPPIGDDVVETLQAGEIAALDVPIEPGDMLWWAGEYGREPEAWHPDAVAAWKRAYERGDVAVDRTVPRQHAVHWEVFSADPAFGLETQQTTSGDDDASGADASGAAVDWTAVEDANGDLVLDPGASDALDLAEEAWSRETRLVGPSGYLDLTPNQRTYFFLDGAGTTLRRHAVKFVSEWGVRDVEAAVDASPDFRAADVAEIERLQWWDDAVDAGVDLPEDRAVWHYHPVAALEAMIATGYSMGPHSISEDGIDLIARFEGFVDELYNDAAGHCTIGYGHLLHHGACTEEDRKEYPDGITEEEARRLLEEDASEAESAVNNLVDVPLRQNQFDALVSFVFNVGRGNFENSTLLEHLNDRKYDEIPKQLNRWTNAGGQELPGLVRRREDEGELFSR